MYHLVRSFGIRQTLRREAPSGVLAFVAAELLYKFHSFALECAAFLATWYALSYVYSIIARLMGKKTDRPAT